VVLALRSEGAVVDFSDMPGIPVGAKLGFVRQEPERKEIAQGQVVDVREEKGLVSIRAGGGVRKGDLVVPCPRPGATEAGPYQELKARAEELQTKAAESQDGEVGQLRKVTDQILAGLAARDAALQQGACDLYPYDTYIAAQAMDLQSLSTSLAPGPAGAPGPETPKDAEPSFLEQAKEIGKTVSDVKNKVCGVVEMFGLPCDLGKGGGLPFGGDSGGKTKAASFLPESSPDFPSGEVPAEGSPGGAPQPPVKPPEPAKPIDPSKLSQAQPVPAGQKLPIKPLDPPKFQPLKPVESQPPPKIKTASAAKPSGSWWQTPKPQATSPVSPKPPPKPVVKPKVKTPQAKATSPKPTQPVQPAATTPRLQLPQK
jgi:hypothetical protein